jgi:hypothetical protein
VAPWCVDDAAAIRVFSCAKTYAEPLFSNKKQQNSFPSNLNDGRKAETKRVRSSNTLQDRAICDMARLLFHQVMSKASRRAFPEQLPNSSWAKFFMGIIMSTAKFFMVM